MPGLEDLASLLGMEPQKKDNQQKGYDGSAIRLKVRVEKRRGKPVTIVWGFQSRPRELDGLLGLCKKKLGAGGQVVDNTLELQGDHVQRVREVLVNEGYVFAK
jgi:translation initiation factor 1 (eIF-1/SUI1)